MFSLGLGAGRAPSADEERLSSPLGLLAIFAPARTRPAARA